MRSSTRLAALSQVGIIDALEPRLLLSASGSLTLVAQFNGPNGAGPTSVIEDMSGNLFGVTNIITPDNGTTIESGGVFEVPAGTSNVQTIVQFNDSAGTVIGRSLIIDSSGNLFGTFGQYNDNQVPGVVFEIPQGSTTLTTLGTFPGFQGTLSELAQSGTLTAIDSSGDLFGYDDDGRAFEVAHGSGTVSELGSSSDGYVRDLQLAPNGNLYGIAAGAGGNSADSIFEIPAGTTTLQTLATFTSATTGTSALGLTFDDGSNIYGFCQAGGSTGDGTVWELPAGGATISVVANFSASTGFNPVSKPVFGTSGNLYGLTNDGGANNDGTLFDVPARSDSAGSNSINDLADLGEDQPAGTNTAGVADDWQGKAIDAMLGQVVKKNPQIFGDNFGPTTHTTATGSRGAIYQYNPAGSGGSGSGGGGGSTTPTSNNIATQQQDLTTQQSTQGSLLGQIKSLKSNPTLAKSLLGDANDASKLIKQASGKLKQSSTLETQYTAESNTIATLQAQLSSATGVQATRIQKKIAADQAILTKKGSQLTTDYNAAVADQSQVTTLQSTLSSSLASQTTTALTFSLVPLTPAGQAPLCDSQP